MCARRRASSQSMSVSSPGIRELPILSDSIRVGTRTRATIRVGIGGCLPRYDSERAPVGRGPRFTGGEEEKGRALLLLLPSYSNGREVYAAVGAWSRVRSISISVSLLALLFSSSFEESRPAAQSVGQGPFICVKCSVLPARPSTCLP